MSEQADLLSRLRDFKDFVYLIISIDLLFLWFHEFTSKLSSVWKSANQWIWMFISLDLPWILMKQADFIFWQNFLVTCVQAHGRCEAQRPPCLVSILDLKITSARVFWIDMRRGTLAFSCICFKYSKTWSQKTPYH